MTPDEIVDALKSGQFDLIRAAATESFRNSISSAEIAHVWSETERSLGALQSVSPEVVLHDLALQCERGKAHLQVAYQDGVLAGLVLLEGSPTGHFGH